MSSQEFGVEELSQAHLEVLAVARCCSVKDWGAANDAINRMDLPAGAYLSAAGILIARLAGRVGPAGQVLDDVTRAVVNNAVDDDD